LWLTICASAGLSLRTGKKQRETRKVGMPSRLWLLVAAPPLGRRVAQGNAGAALAPASGCVSTATAQVEKRLGLSSGDDKRAKAGLAFCLKGADEFNRHAGRPDRQSVRAFAVQGPKKLAERRFLR
jgi:hypothetical protein